MSSLGTDRRCKPQPHGDWPARFGVRLGRCNKRKSQRLYPARNTLLSCAGLLIRKRRDKARFYVPARAPWSSAPMCRSSHAKSLASSIRINNCDASVLIRCAAGCYPSRKERTGSVHPARSEVFPWLRREEDFANAFAENTVSFIWLPITIFGWNQSHEKPHCQKWDRCPKGVARFGNETATSWLQHTIHLSDDACLFGQNSEQSRSQDDIEGSIGTRQLEGVDSFKATIGQMKRLGSLAGPLHLFRRTIHSGN